MVSLSKISRDCFFFSSAWWRNTVWTKWCYPRTCYTKLQWHIKINTSFFSRVCLVWRIPAGFSQSPLVPSMCGGQISRDSAASNVFIPLEAESGADMAFLPPGRSKEGKYCCAGQYQASACRASVNCLLAGLTTWMSPESGDRIDQTSYSRKHHGVTWQSVWKQDSWKHVRSDTNAKSQHQLLYYQS